MNNTQLLVSDQAPIRLTCARSSPAQTGPMESLASDEIPYFEVTYLYRDASNYKYWGSFKIRGVLAVDELRPHMLMNDYFVPEAVGIRSLTPSERNDDDHDLHEIIAIEPAVTGPYAFTAADLVMSFQRQNSIGWFS